MEQRALHGRERGEGDVRVIRGKGQRSSIPMCLPGGLREKTGTPASLTSLSKLPRVRHPRYEDEEGRQCFPAAGCRRTIPTSESNAQETPRLPFCFCPRNDHVRDRALVRGHQLHQPRVPGVCKEESMLNHIWRSRGCQPHFHGGICNGRDFMPQIYRKEERQRF